MIRLFRRLGLLTSLFGFDPRKLGATMSGIPAFWRDYRKLRRQFRTSNKEFPFGRFSPYIGEGSAESGTASGHYFHQDLLVAQWVHADNPARHVDVGSRTDGFVAHVAAFRPIEVFDIRPLRSTARNIEFKQCDFMADDLPWREYCDSASCLHALEHFGLGRYGDTPDYYGYRRGWENLHRLLKPGGTLYFSTPMGPQRLEFNGQRVFSLPYLLSMIEGLYDVRRFAYVNQSGDLVPEADPRSEAGARSFDCMYGCAIFTLVKR